MKKVNVQYSFESHSEIRDLLEFLKPAGFLPGVEGMWAGTKGVGAVGYGIIDQVEKKVTGWYNSDYMRSDPNQPVLLPDRLTVLLGSRLETFVEQYIQQNPSNPEPTQTQ